MSESQEAKNPDWLRPGGTVVSIERGRSHSNREGKPIPRIITLAGCGGASRIATGSPVAGRCVAKGFDQMGRIYKPTYTRPIPKTAEIITKKGKRFARVRIGGVGAKPMLAPLTKAGDKCIVPISKWWAVYRDAEDELVRVPLFSDKTISRRRLSELELKVDRLKSGTADPHEHHLTRPLAELIKEFRRNLEDNDRSEGYVDDVISYVSTTLDACGYRRLNDVDAVQIDQYLARRRAKGLSHGGHNSYVKALKAFGSWLLKNRRCARNPFTTSTRLNPNVDRKLVRRPADLEELRLLIESAGRRGPFLGVDGSDRAMLYLVASCTGFRASELASITLEGLDLESQVPTITVDAAYSKRRQRDVQPIPPQLAGSLRNWLKKRPHLRREGRLWPGTWHKRAAEMLREDLAAARKSWIKKATAKSERDRRRNDPDFLQPMDSAGRALDFHALRGTFATNLARAGVHPKAAQQLMRHSDINLTMMTYTTLPDSDIAAELGRLVRMEDAADRTTCNVSCSRLAHGQEHLERNSTKNSGAAGTRTQNQRIMSPLL
jgi:integrase/recombinase XerC